MVQSTGKPSRQLKVVDCDTHFWQPLATWRPLIESQHRDAVVACLASLDVGDEAFARAGVPLEMQTDASGRRYNDVGDDVPERLEYMDSKGVDVQIVFPGARQASLIPDATLAAAACRAVNRWSAK